MATNEQIAEMLSEGTGTSISAGTLSPTKGSKRLSWEDITDRFAEGAAIGQGELLPTIPTAGMTDSSGNPITASTFYRESGISPTIFSQPSFSNFETAIAKSQGTADVASSPSAGNVTQTPIRQRRIPEDSWTGMDDEQSQREGEYLSLGPTIPAGKLDFSKGLTGLIMQLGGGIADIYSGKKEQVFAVPSLDETRHTDEFMTGLFDYHGVSDRAREQISIFQNMGFGTMYNIGDDQIVTPTEYYTTGPGTENTGKVAENFWQDWEEGSSWNMDAGFTSSSTPSSMQGDRSVPDPDAGAYVPAQQEYHYDDYPADDGGDGDFGGAGDAVGASDADSDSWGDMDSDDGYMASGGRVGMQEGGEAEMANLGMINEQAAAPQDGGQQSVKDDIPREADSGDYILPYETVLEVGLKQLNRYAKEAIQLAIKNGVNLKGTDLDPTDDVPIKVSNYEYHIPKALVPYFGGGKKYLDKIRDEGLALRKRLEEEKQPSAQEQQPMQPPQPQPQAAPAPPPQMMAEAPAAPMPMMAEGGFVLGQQEDKQSVEQSLTADTSQPTQSAYNQVQAIERSRIQKQQPPMVDPTGRVVQQVRKSL